MNLLAYIGTGGLATLLFVFAIIAFAIAVWRLLVHDIVGMGAAIVLGVILLVLA